MNAKAGSTCDVFKSLTYSDPALNIHLTVDTRRRLKHTFKKPEKPSGLRRENAIVGNRLGYDFMWFMTDDRRNLLLNRLFGTFSHLVLGRSLISLT